MRFRARILCVAVFLVAGMALPEGLAVADSPEPQALSGRSLGPAPDSRASVHPDHRTERAGTCSLPRNRMRCRIYGRYSAWSVKLIVTGDANPKARWTKKERRYLRNHPKVARELGPLSIFRQPGKRGFHHRTKVRRDHRAGLAKGGGPNYCTTLTISRLVESTFFRADLFTAKHKVRWCWDNDRVYDQGEGNWSEIIVHDGSAVENEGAIDGHNAPLPTSGEWYSMQQYKICNCIVKYGAISHWQPLWQVWASPGGKYRWKAHW